MSHLLAEAPAVPAPARKPSPRFYELDWLRVLVILALVPGHALGFFTAAVGQYLGTGYASPISLATLTTLSTFGISVLFLVAGAATTFALGRRSPRQFIGERCVRLLVPFAFATLTLIPLQDFIIVRTFPGVLGQASLPAGWEPRLADSPLAFYWWYLGAYASFLTHYTPQHEIIFWSQIWFIPRLLVISLVTLPLLLWLQDSRGRQLIANLADMCERHRGVVFLLAVPLGLVLVALGWQWQVWEIAAPPDRINVLAQTAFYLVIYMYGFLLYSDERLRRVVRRDGLLALALVVPAFMLTQIPGLGNQALAHDYSAVGILAAFVRGLAAWLCVLAVIGLSLRLFTFTNRLGQYLEQASYPFYVLHMAVLCLVGLPILAGATTYPILRYLAIVVLTYAATFGVYELVICRVPFVRMLFGLRSKPAAAST